MLRFILSFLLLLVVTAPAAATVELALEGASPVAIDEVYHRQGQAYLALDDVLPALGLRGDWDSVAHVYRIRTPRGTAVISPGSQYLRLDGRFVPLRNPPQFIDGRLRVTGDFIRRNLADLLEGDLYYRNLDPTRTTDADDTPLDRLFSFLLRKKERSNGPPLRAVALDPGHGGPDTGAIGLDKVKEKDVALQMAERLGKQLKMQMGIPVYLSRDDDYALTREAHLKPATRPDVDALLLLHAQAAFTETPKGISLFIRPRSRLERTTPDPGHGSRQLAGKLRQALEQAGFTVRGIFEAPLLPLGRGDLPSVLVEMGYLSNPSDQARLTAPDQQRQLALALYQGIKEFAEGQKEKRQ